MNADRWSLEQVAAVAPSPGAVAVAEAFTDASRWSGSGADERAVWGRCQGSSHEPYDTVVDHVGVGWRCSCPSRVRPCKHALALLLRWVRGEVAPGTPPSAVTSWVDRRTASAVAAGSSGAGSSGAGSSGAGSSGAGPSAAGAGSSAGPARGAATPSADRDRSRDERVARMRAGLIELQRWLEDRMRTGLNDPSLGRYATWDELAARLVDARVGGLANRVRRVAGLVGVGTDWHERVLAELGALFLIVQGALRLAQLSDGITGIDGPGRVDGAGASGGRGAGAIAGGVGGDHDPGWGGGPVDLAGAVALAAGWQIRQADVLAGIPETDDWVVAGRSDAREDRIEVRRIWLWGTTTRRWAMLLSFAAYGQGLDESLRVGEVRPGDLFRYPGSGLRALLGPIADDTSPDEPHRSDGSDPPDRLVRRIAMPEPLDIAGACRAVGEAIAAEPWLERLAVTVLAAPTVADGRWVLTDATGSLPLVGDEPALATLVASSLGGAVPVTVEWTPSGVLPLTVHQTDRAVDIGPRADPSFVGGGR